VRLGAAEVTSPGARPWLEMGAAAGIGDRIEFTGVVDAEELSRRLRACDLIVFVNEEGPSSRKTTLAAAMAHGMPIVALDGPEQWRELRDARAVEISPPRAAALSAVVGGLLADDRRRQELAARARAFYEDHMTLASVADALETIVETAAAARMGRRPRAT